MIYEYSQLHCNPINYLELIKPDRTGWWFNTSMVKQINIWLGRYHVICRKMLVYRYNFFLDEMMRRKDVLTVK